MQNWIKAIDAIKKGNFDFIVKPYRPEYLVHTIGRAIKHAKLIHLEKDCTHVLEIKVTQKTQELADALMRIKYVSKEIIQRLAAAEFEDTETGAHIPRISL